MKKPQRVCKVCGAREEDGKFECDGHFYHYRKLPEKPTGKFLSLWCRGKFVPVMGKRRKA
jgi:hypothetical protein